MKTKIYVRVGRGVSGSLRGRTYTKASTKPDHSPLENADGHVPTVAFAIALDIPDSLFSQAERVLAELTVSESTSAVAASIEVPGEAT